jgi:hypothetical protein
MRLILEETILRAVFYHVEIKSYMLTVERLGVLAVVIFPTSFAQISLQIGTILELNICNMSYTLNLRIHRYMVIP